MTKDFKYAVDADGIATITWDMPDKTMNVMSREGFIQFDGDRKSVV